MAVLFGKGGCIKEPNKGLQGKSVPPHIVNGVRCGPAETGQKIKKPLPGTMNCFLFLPRRIRRSFQQPHKTERRGGRVKRVMPSRDRCVNVQFLGFFRGSPGPVFILMFNQEGLAAFECFLDLGLCGRIFKGREVRWGFDAWAFRVCFDRFPVGGLAPGLFPVGSRTGTGRQEKRKKEYE